MNPLDLYDQPARLGQLGAELRHRAFADRIWVRTAPSHESSSGAVLIRGEEVTDLAAWPEPQALGTGVRLVVHVDANPGERQRYVAWLRALAESAPADLSIAPHCRQPGGMHQLWCIAAARVLLPAPIRVEARHDLIGIRLAQLAVGFGADTLAGPMERDRTLPLAGVTRPNEATPAGLATLVQQVGLEPHAA